MTKTINDRLKQVRIYFKMNQREMSELLGVKQSYYSEVENNKRTVTSKLVEALSREKHVSADWLYSGVGNEIVFTNSDKGSEDSRPPSSKTSTFLKKQLREKLEADHKNLLGLYNALEDIEYQLHKAQQIMPFIALSDMENSLSTPENYMSAIITHLTILTDLKKGKEIIAYYEQTKAFLDKMKTVIEHPAFSA